MRRAALDPQARAAAQLLVSAGGRVDRSHGLRVTMPGGRRTLDGIYWPEPTGANGAAPGSAGRRGARAPLAGEATAVAAVQRAAPFIPVDRLGELLDHVSPSANLRPHEERFHRLHATGGPGGAGTLAGPGGDTNLPRAARTVMGGTLAGTGDVPRERPQTARTYRTNNSSLGHLLARDFTTGGPLAGAPAGVFVPPRSPAHAQTTAPVIGSAAAAARVSAGPARRAMPHTASSIAFG
jgi:hypothetical protein